MPFVWSEIRTAVEAGASLAANGKQGCCGTGGLIGVSIALHNLIYIQIFGYWHLIGFYPHPFHNILRFRINGPPVPKIEFPNIGTQKRGLLEFPLLRSPRVEIYGQGTDPSLNPDRVVFRIIDNSVTFMGIMSHVGSKYQGFHIREFVVSGFYF